MIKWIGVSILVTMLFLSMGFQIVAINKSPKCDVKKSLVLNCTNLDYYCKSFLDTKGALYQDECCKNIDCILHDKRPKIYPRVLSGSFSGPLYLVFDFK